MDFRTKLQLVKIAAVVGASGVPPTVSPSNPPKVITPAPVKVLPPTTPQPAPQPQGLDIDRLYSSLQTAETGGEKNPWIRTKVQPKGGSTAYGPVQVTGSLVRDYMNRKPHIFDEDLRKTYIPKFTQQAQMFATYGREPKKNGYHVDFDYGGRGNLYTPDNHDGYHRMSKALLREMAVESNNELPRVIQRWRGVPQTADPGYYQKVIAGYGK